MRLIDALCETCRRPILATGVWTPPRTCSDCQMPTVTNLQHLDARESAAIHEAGHVVAGLACEYTICFAALESSGRPGSTAHYLANVREYQVGSSGHAVMGLAGAAATRRWAGSQGFTSDADLLEVANTGLSDMEEMYELGWSHQDLADRAVDAAAVVDMHWSAIEQVAGRLLQAGRLDGDEIARIARIGVTA